MDSEKIRAELEELSAQRIEIQKEIVKKENDLRIALQKEKNGQALEALKTFKKNFLGKMMEFHGSLKNTYVLVKEIKPVDNQESDKYFCYSVSGEEIVAYYSTKGNCCSMTVNATKYTPHNILRVKADGEIVNMGARILSPEERAEKIEMFLIFQRKVFEGLK